MMKIKKARLSMNKTIKTCKNANFRAGSRGCDCPRKYLPEKEKRVRSALLCLCPMKRGKMDKKPPFVRSTSLRVSLQVSGGEGEAHANGPITPLSNELPKKFKNCKNAKIRAAASLMKIFSKFFWKSVDGMIVQLYNSFNEYLIKGCRNARP